MESQINQISPLIPNIIPSINRNQVVPSESELINLRSALKTQPQYIYCPYCKSQGLTQVEKKCSKSNITCSIFSLGVFWAIFQACRGKDVSCYDSEHKCSNSKCNEKLSDYRAC